MIRAHLNEGATLQASPDFLKIEHIARIGVGLNIYLQGGKVIRLEDDSHNLDPDWTQVRRKMETIPLVALQRFVGCSIAKIEAGGSSISYVMRENGRVIVETSIVWVRMNEDDRAFSVNFLAESPAVRPTVIEEL